MKDLGDELLEAALELSVHAEKDRDPAIIEPLERAGTALEKFNRSASGSWLGYHAHVYYRGFHTPPPGARFSVEWGLMSSVVERSRGEWQEYSDDMVRKAIAAEIGPIDLAATKVASTAARRAFDEIKSRVQVALAAANSEKADRFIEKLEEEVKQITPLMEAEIARRMRPGNVISRDSTAIGQGFTTPPHVSVFAEMAALRQPFKACEKLDSLARQGGSFLTRRQKSDTRRQLVGTNVFIGHGRSSVWKDLRDFIRDRLRLPWDEFNRVPVAGVTNIGRLRDMLDAASVAFLVMTGEDEQHDGKLNARMNVIHEAGLFQGRLGFERAIILLEEGCEEFSNVNGLGQIRFPKGNIAPKFEEIRMVLEREGLLETN